MAESSLHLEESQAVLHLNWSPEAPAGLNFKNVVPDDFGAGYRALPTESEQKELKSRMRSTRMTSRRHSKVYVLS